MQTLFWFDFWQLDDCNIYPCLLFRIKAFYFAYFWVDAEPSNCIFFFSSFLLLWHLIDTLFSFIASIPDSTPYTKCMQHEKQLAVKSNRKYDKKKWLDNDWRSGWKMKNLTRKSLLENLTWKSLSEMWLEKVDQEIWRHMVAAAFSNNSMIASSNNLWLTT